MINTIKTVLLKLSGESLTQCSQQGYLGQETPSVTDNYIQNLTEQIKKLLPTHRFAIVIGGGNFFRARYAKQELKLRQPVADAVGMLATAMNGLILQEYFNQNGISSVLLSAVPLPSLAKLISQSAIDDALTAKKIIIFCGGTGNPYFTTDTTAILRALQVNTNEVWKATNVDYVYDDDPKINKTCKPLYQISYQEIIQRQLTFMDLTAITLAQQHKVKIRFFNAFTPNALEEVARTPSFGSTIL